MALNVFGLVFGGFLILDGIAGWGLVATVRPASKTEIRVSEVIIGGIFIVLAILRFAGAI
jgi:hypothetical protein